MELNSDLKHAIAILAQYHELQPARMLPGVVIIDLNAGAMPGSAAKRAEYRIALVEIGIAVSRAQSTSPVLRAGTFADIRLQIGAQGSQYILFNATAYWH